MTWFSVIRASSLQSGESSRKENSPDYMEDGSYIKSSGRLDVLHMAI
jgi:hypothetical protein